MVKIKTNIEVRFTDVDSQLHVNHTAIVEYLAHCRVQLLHHIEEVEDSKYDHVLVHLAVNLCEPLCYPADAVVTGYILEVGSKSVTTRYLIHSAGRLIADAECVNVVVRSGTTTSVLVPVELRDLLENGG